jgi:hypothetical protein
MESCAGQSGTRKNGKKGHIMTTANIAYNPTPNAGEHTTQPISVFIAGVVDMLTSQDVVGSVDIFGEVLTAQAAAEMQMARRAHAAQLLRKYADALDAA